MTTLNIPADLSNYEMWWWNGWMVEVDNFRYGPVNIKHSCFGQGPTCWLFFTQGPYCGKLYDFCSVVLYYIRYENSPLNFMSMIRMSVILRVFDLWSVVTAVKCSSGPCRWERWGGGAGSRGVLAGDDERKLIIYVIFPRGQLSNSSPQPGPTVPPLLPARAAPGEMLRIPFKLPNLKLFISENNVITKLSVVKSRILRTE